MRHIPDMLLDFMLFFDDIKTPHLSASGSRGNDPAEHPDSRGFSRAIRTKKPENLPFLDFEINPVDRGKRAEFFLKILDADRDIIWAHPVHIL